MSWIRSLLIALALSGLIALIGCGGDDASGDAGDAGGEEPAAEEPAAEEPAAEEPAAAAGDIKGEWTISLSVEEQAELDAAKAALEANPEDQMSKAMVEMMEGMLTAMVLTIGDDKMSMAMGDTAEEVSYTLAGDQLTSTEADGKAETVTVGWDGDVMTWVKEGEEKTMRWQRK